MTTLEEAWQRTRRLHQQIDRLSMVGQGWSEATPGQFMFNPPSAEVIGDTIGACCHWYGCEDLTEAECLEDENYPVWMGAGTRCEDVECPVGACCCPGDPECFTATQGLCEACCPSCIYQGDFSECDPNPCPCIGCEVDIHLEISAEAQWNDDGFGNSLSTSMTYSGTVSPREDDPCIYCLCVTGTRDQSPPCAETEMCYKVLIVTGPNSNSIVYPTMFLVLNSGSCSESGCPEDWLLNCDTDDDPCGPGYFAQGACDFGACIYDSCTGNLGTFGSPPDSSSVTATIWPV